MIVEIYGTKVEIIEHPTSIDGLLFSPEFKDFDNDADWLEFTRPASREVSAANFNAVASIEINGPAVEIGVSRNGNGSFTEAILRNKSQKFPYLGIDIDNKSYLDSAASNVHTLQCRSTDRHKVISKMELLGIRSLFLLLIDGWHSMNGVLNDWAYSELVCSGGYVVLHDTNGHPPAVFIHAIDRNKYEVVQLFQGEDDYGLTICRKKS